MKASNKQIRLIWWLSKQLGMDSEALHEAVFGITGERHISRLNQDQAKMTIHHLERMIRKDQTILDPVRMTKAQRGKIFKLMYLLKWQKKQLDGLAKRVTGVHKIEWLTRHQAYDLIEAMRAILRRRDDGRYPEEIFE